jgi:DMSO reductase anchor subunit
VRRSLGISAALLGIIGVFCSMMIYHDTRRVLWHWRRSVALFFGSTAALGLSALFACNPSNGWALSALVLALTVKLIFEISVLRHGVDRALTSLKKTALLITRRFQHVAFARLLCAATGLGLALLLHVGTFPWPSAVAWLPFALILVGEILERSLFFRAVDAPKMPGGLPS